MHETLMEFFFSFIFMMIIRRISSEKGSIKKFYKRCTIGEHDSGFQLFLDHRSLKTPSGTLMILPSQALALAVVSEWEIQKDYIKVFTMPLVFSN